MRPVVIEGRVVAAGPRHVAVVRRFAEAAEVLPVPLAALAPALADPAMPRGVQRLTVPGVVAAMLRIKGDRHG